LLFSLVHLILCYAGKKVLKYLLCKITELQKIIMKVAHYTKGKLSKLDLESTINKVESQHGQSLSIESLRKPGH